MFQIFYLLIKLICYYISHLKNLKHQMRKTPVKSVKTANA